MSVKYVCTKQGVHGKLWRVGDKATGERLKQLGGFIPEYFQPVDTQEAQELQAELDENNNRYLSVEELKNFLIAKDVSFPGNISRKGLLKKVAELKKGSSDDLLD